MIRCSLLLPILFLVAESLVTSLVSNTEFAAGLPATRTRNFGFSLEEFSGLNSQLRKCNGTDLHFEGCQCCPTLPRLLRLLVKLELTFGCRAIVYSLLRDVASFA